MEYEYLVQAFADENTKSPSSETKYLNSKAKEGYRLIQVLDYEGTGYKYYFERKIKK